MSVQKKHKRILIADDNAGILHSLRVRLDHLGYDVVTSTDAYNALAKARQERPHVMILDVNMPAGDGFSVHERMNSVPDMPPIPVIYLTGDKSERLDDFAEKLGAVGILHKPFEFNDLMTLIEDALRPRPSSDAA